MSDTTNNPTPAALIQTLAYHIRWPARTPSTRLTSVTASAETRVGSSAVATRHPIGRKKRRSAHSSTTGPLLAYTGAGVIEHGFDRGERFHCLLVRDHEGRIETHLGIVDHCDHAPGEQRVEDLARDSLVEQFPRPGRDEIHSQHQTAAAHVADDGNVLLPGLHLRQHPGTEATTVLHQAFVDNRLDRHVRGGGGQRIAAIAGRAATRVGPWLGECDRLPGGHGASPARTRRPTV